MSPFEIPPHRDRVGDPPVNPGVRWYETAVALGRWWYGDQPTGGFAWERTPAPAGPWELPSYQGPPPSYHPKWARRGASYWERRRQGQARLAAQQDERRVRKLAAVRVAKPVRWNLADPLPVWAQSAVWPPQYRSPIAVAVPLWEIPLIGAEVP